MAYKTREIYFPLCSIVFASAILPVVVLVLDSACSENCQFLPRRDPKSKQVQLLENLMTKPTSEDTNVGRGRRRRGNGSWVLRWSWRWIERKSCCWRAPWIFFWERKGVEWVGQGPVTCSDVGRGLMRVLESSSCDGSL